MRRGLPRVQHESFSLVKFPLQQKRLQVCSIDFILTPKFLNKAVRSNDYNKHCTSLGVKQYFLGIKIYFKLKRKSNLNYGTIFLQEKCPVMRIVSTRTSLLPFDNVEQGYLTF
jgi:hypothetical protein